MNQELEQKTVNRKTLLGTVVSTKSKQTITVLVERQCKDPYYKKIIKRRKKFLAHDAEETCNEGDFVAIEECRPISKRKSFNLKEILRRKEIIQ
ncbi:MAG TPA: 30S ribosomal protein S17 [Vampirovibrionales bacterium]